MARKKVTRLRKFCGELAGHSWTQAERIAAAATDAVRKWLPDNQETVDLLHLQICLGEKLGEDRDRLTAIDNEHMHELQVDSNLREERDAANAATREVMLRMRASFDGLFGTGGSAKVFEDAPVIPIDPVEVHQLTGHVYENLLNPDFPMPAPRQTGFTLDRAAAAADLEGPHQRLGAALTALAAAKSHSKFSQARKDTEVAEVAGFAGKVARFYEALYALTGFDGLAKRVRRSSHRAATAAASAEGEAAEAVPVPDALIPDAEGSDATAAPASTTETS